MTKTKVILIVSFVLVFAAGAALGVLLARPEKRPPHPSSWLAAELNLSAEQRKQMEAVWSEAMGATFARHGEKRAAVVQERDQAIQALLSEAQQAQYQAIQQDYTRKMNELSQERKRVFDDAVERTKRILTPEQATKYEELMKRHRERGMGPGPGGFRGRRRPPPATEPTTSERPAPHGEEREPPLPE